MYIPRLAYTKLLDWKASKRRKPLLIRGGRQVGKTTLIREFAKEFDDYIELSLEKSIERNLFERTDEIDKILRAIYLPNTSQHSCLSTKSRNHPELFKC